MHPRDLRIEDYSYTLPDDRIAAHPLTQRDAARLLVYERGTIAGDVFGNIANHLPPGALAVFNQTRVIHARLLFRKPTGGAIEVFCLAPGPGYAGIHTAMSQRGEVVWECLVGGAGKWKHGTALQLVHGSPGFTLTARISGKTAAAYLLTLAWDNPGLTFADVLHHAGKVPLPPYLHRDAEPGDEASYQTVYAREEGSVAAPTAGLHFTPEVLQRMDERGIETAFVTLHVGAGTFKPVKSDTMEGHHMHEEWMEVSRTLVSALAAAGGRKVVAVGTTSLRTLESLYWMGARLLQTGTMDLTGIAVTQWQPYESPAAYSTAGALQALAAYMEANAMDKIMTRTQILIAPGYEFRVADGLVTNFHQPRSTLLLLVAAFAGEGWHTIYDHAMSHGYRFLSYGDGSLLWTENIRKAL